MFLHLCLKTSYKPQVAVLREFLTWPLTFASCRRSWSRVRRVSLSWSCSSSSSRRCSWRTPTPRCCWAASSTSCWPSPPSCWSAFPRRLSSPRRCCAAGCTWRSPAWACPCWWCCGRTGNRWSSLWTGWSSRADPDRPGRRQCSQHLHPSEPRASPTKTRTHQETKLFWIGIWAGFESGSRGLRRSCTSHLWPLTSDQTQRGGEHLLLCHF